MITPRTDSDRKAISFSDSSDTTELGRRIADSLISAQNPVMLDLTRTMRDFGLSHEKYHLLSFLNYKGEEPVMMTELSRRLGISTAAGTGIVDRLEKLHYVNRVPNPGDRRKIQVEITPKGRQVIEKIRLALGEIIIRTMQEGDDNRNSRTIEDFRQFIGWKESISSAEENNN